MASAIPTCGERFFPAFGHLIAYGRWSEILAALTTPMTTPVDEPVHVVPYDACWPQWYAEERARWFGAVVEHAVEVEHFGSTAVPGLASKPIIDILVGLRPGARCTAEARAILCAHGYEDLGEAGVPGRIYLRLRGERSFNVALVEHGAELWTDNLALRDLLRIDGALAEKYGKHKEAAVRRGATTLVAYSEQKAEFVRTLIERARQRSASGDAKIG